ncbi:MAG: hypothetical protein IJL88_13525 [Clostridia bacterium]|nr:hypothetical protein [Clostridia bacterium]
MESEFFERTDEQMQAHSKGKRAEAPLYAVFLGMQENCVGSITRLQIIGKFRGEATLVLEKQK